MAKNKKRRIDVMREMMVGDAMFSNELLPEGATASDARDMCRKMARNICSSVNALMKNEDMKFQTSTTTAILSTANPRLVCTMVVERIK